MSYVNLPNRYEAFVLEEGEHKILYKPETKMTNAGKFMIQKEDHTVGNALRMKLLEDPQVLFAGYKIPHPLKYEVVIMVRTRDRTKTPLDAFNNAVMEIQNELTAIKQLFSDAVRDFEEANPPAEDERPEYR
eukprot:196233_1